MCVYSSVLPLANTSIARSARVRSQGDEIPAYDDGPRRPRMSDREHRGPDQRGTEPPGARFAEHGLDERVGHGGVDTRP
jgi:hypothetical protein